MNIAFSTDDNYVLPTFVTATSIIKHNDTKLDFYILTQGLSECNIKLLRSLKDKSEKVSVEILVIDKNIFTNFPIRLNDHVTLAAYYRIILPQILDKNFDKVLYLDGDLLCLDSIIDFYNTDLTGYSLRAVHDERNNDPEIFKRLCYSPQTEYFNSGVILINLSYWRENSIQEKCIAYISNNPDRCLWHDQDALNKVLNGTVLWADFRYNFTQGFFFNKRDLMIDEKYYNDIDIAKKNPCILHFSSAYKPWHYECNHPLKKIYRNFCKEATGQKINLTHKLHGLSLVKWYFKKFLNTFTSKKYADFRKPE